MSTVTLKVPTLVQTYGDERQNSYYLQPLFLGYPVASNPRFEQAMAQYKKEFRHMFKGFTLDQQNTENLLWYVFNPEVTYHNFHLHFSLGKHQINGNFGVASFELQGKTFVSIPALQNFMFLDNRTGLSKKQVHKKVERAVRHRLREIQKAEGNDFEPKTYYSSKKIFVTEVELNVTVGQSKFKFERNDLFSFFASMNRSGDFDGALEIEMVGYNFKSLYPAELRRAYLQDDLVQQVYQILYQEENTPLVVIGPEGVGKHTIMHEVVHRHITRFYKKTSNKNRRLWHIDPNRIISGMSIVGMWQKRFEAILQYVLQPSDSKKYSDSILFDNCIALLRIGKSAQNNMNLSDVLKPYLEKRLLQVILLATPEEWKVMQEQDRRFSDLFQVIRLQEPRFEEAVRMVLEQRKALENENNCTITIQAVAQLFNIQRNYLKSKALPGSVMQLLTQLAVKYRQQTIDLPEVREEFRVFSGLQERIFDPSYTFDKNDVRREIARNLVGQAEAVEALTNAVNLIKAKLTDNTKPLSSFLFIGPTGVGKTQAAKVLCQYLLGDEDHLMRFDMNEYIDGGAVQRLIGDYYNPEGQLTGMVRYRPFGILLLDEIEKAHPSVHDLLLQVLDDGRLTDSLGRTVDFTNTIIIMTSNVGAQEVSRQLGFETASRSETSIYRKAVERQFRPEFINRIDKIVIFQPLELEHILGIARLQIKELLQRDGFVRRTTILNISQAALEWVARRGYDSRMGGRALKRQIERDLTMLSAEQLISTNNDSPIIFDILLDQQADQLTPKIEPLDFAEPLEEDWLPHLPNVAKGRSFYKRLLRSIELLEGKIDAYESSWDLPTEQVIMNEDEGFGWQHYDFKNRMADVKEQISTISLGFKDRYFKEAPAIPLRLKRGSLLPRRDFGTKGMRENLKDRLFQEEALKEISEAYQYGTAQFDSISTEFLNNYFDVAFLQLAGQDLLRGRIQKVRLRFESCITGQGKEEIQFLKTSYAKLLEELDIQHERSKKEAVITAEGYALDVLLQGESGIHLFYKSHQNPLPIRLILERDGQTDVAQMQVIRIYDGRDTLTDLRSNFSNAVNITPREFKLLLFAGIPGDIRQELVYL